jgi:hypothetical protein
VLYHLSHDSSPFCSGYFEDKVSLCSDQPELWAFYFMLPAITVITHMPSFFLFRLGLINIFFAWTGPKHQSSWSQPPKSLEL